MAIFYTPVVDNRFYPGSLSTFAIVIDNVEEGEIMDCLQLRFADRRCLKVCIDL